MRRGFGECGGHCDFMPGYWYICLLSVSSALLTDRTVNRRALPEKCGSSMAERRKRTADVVLACDVGRWMVLRSGAYI